MKTFLAIYMSAADTARAAEWQALDEATRQARAKEGGTAWHGWMAEHANAVVVQGGPLGKTKRADASGVSDMRNALTGYVVVQAESHDAASAMFENHPYFTILPGDRVEIMECLPMPEL